MACAGGAVVLTLVSETTFSSLFGAIVPGAVALVGDDTCGEGAMAQSDSFDGGVLAFSDAEGQRLSQRDDRRVRYTHHEDTVRTIEQDLPAPRGKISTNERAMNEFSDARAFANVHVVSWQVTTTGNHATLAEDGPEGARFLGKRPLCAKRLPLWQPAFGKLGEDDAIQTRLSPVGGTSSPPVTSYAAW